MSHTPVKYIQPEDFVAKWIEAYEHDKGQRWIADELGIAYHRVISRASYMRRYGINLPPLLYRSKRLDDASRAELNALIKRTTGYEKQ